MSMRTSTYKQQGFTLVELIAVIVLLGVIGGGTVGFIQRSVQAYKEVTNREEVAQIGRIAIEKMSREIRTALPGSIRVSASNTCIEFVPIISASSYLELSNLITDSANTFSLASKVLPTTVTRAAVYTLSENDVYANVDSDPSGFIRTFNTASLVSSAGVDTYTFSSPAQSFTNSSPFRRMYFVNMPVSYCVSGTNLYRYESTGYQAAPPTAATVATGALVAELVQTNEGGAVQVFRYAPGVLANNGIVHLDLRFLVRSTNDEYVRFNHDIALRGEP